MRKGLIMFTVLTLLLIFSFNQVLRAADSLKTVRLIEVVHSIFYGPQYVALNQNYFKEEGLDIELTTAWGGDKAAASLMAGSGDIALIGPEPSIYVYQRGAKNYIINFAQLTNTAGSFLVARKPMPDFKWEDVKGKTIIGNRPGGAPEMVLEYSLKSRGLYPGKDVEVITNLDFTANAGAFISGTGDFVQLFEPVASKLEVKEQGYVVGSFGEGGGNVPYTVYMAKKNYVSDNPEIIKSFTRVVYRAQKWVANHTASQIAEEIKPFFMDTDMEILIKVINRYKTQGTWDTDPLIEKDIFEHYEDIIIMAGELDRKIPYEILVNVEFARQVINN